MFSFVSRGGGSLKYIIQLWLVKMSDSVLSSEWLGALCGGWNGRYEGWVGWWLQCVSRMEWKCLIAPSSRSLLEATRLAPSPRSSLRTARSDSLQPLRKVQLGCSG